MERESFIFYADWWEHLQMLSDSDALSVIRAIFAYERAEEVPKINGAAAMAFSFIRAQLDRDNAKWENTRKARQVAGRMGGIATQNKNRIARDTANLLEQNKQGSSLLEQNQANQAVPVPVPVPERNISSSETDEGGRPKGKKTTVFPQDSNAYKAAALLARLILERNPELKPRTERDLQRWANDIDKINRLDGYEWEMISDVLTFSQRDPFWQTHTLSGAKLRKQFETLYAQMKRGGSNYD